MAVLVTKTDEGYNVNDKPIYQDSNGNWIAQIELSSTEKQAFNNYLKSI